MLLMPHSKKKKTLLLVSGDIELSTKGNARLSDSGRTCSGYFRRGFKLFMNLLRKDKFRSLSTHF